MITIARYRTCAGRNTCWKIAEIELEQTLDQTEKEKNVLPTDKADVKAKVIFQKAIEHFPGCCEIQKRI